MAVSLITEVMDYLTGTDVTPAERYILVAIAEQANVKTRQAWQEYGGGGKRRWVLAERVGLSETGLRTALQRLANRGLEVRVALGTDARGRAFYAAHGHQTTYRVPVLPKREGDAQASPNGDAQAQEGDVSPSAKGDAQAREGDATAREGDAQASPYPSDSRQSPNSKRAREPRHIVMEHTDAKPSEAEAVVARIVNEVKPRTLGGFINHLAQSGDLQTWVNEARAAGIKADIKTANELRQRMPPCEHGRPGGDQPHPTSGEPWCIDCRFRQRAQRLNGTAAPPGNADVIRIDSRRPA